MEFKNGRMEENMQENGKMILGMDLEIILTEKMILLKENFTLETGRKANRQR